MIEALVKTPSLRVVDIGPDHASQWNAFVGGSPAASLYHMYEWRDVIEGTFGHETIYVAAFDADQVVGVFPVVRLRSMAFGHMLVSLPFFNYGGICARSEDVRRALLERGIEIARASRAGFLEIREESEWRDPLPCKTGKVSMRLRLPASSDELWKSIGSKLRNQVQRPRKEGMEARVGRDEALDSFYDVFAENMRDLGTPVYPKTFFRNILRRFPDRTWIVTVFMKNVPVAAGFLAGFKGRLEIPWASSLRAYNRFSPNMLLYWRTLEFACEQRYETFDFGRSTPGEGTFKFKEQWGATPHQLYWYYWLPDGAEMPQVNPKNPKYRAAIAMWQRLPLAVTRLLGPRIVKYIP